MKIIIDAYGGDNSPSEIVKGSILAVAEKSGFDIVLVGKEIGINAILSELEYDKSRVSVVNAEDVITCDDTPTEAIRKKTDSSIVKGLKLLKEDDNAKAFVSAGSTGAVLTGAVLLTRRVMGVSRPALAPTLPTLTGGQVMLLDCGANVDCKPINLLQFAIMGVAYMENICGKKNPKVALLCNGTEDKKGNALTHEAFELLKNAEGINFVGNMEARDILSGEYDVVVSDGFYGNIALKSIEGAAGCIFAILKKEIKASKKASVGALLMKGAFKKVKATVDYNKKGGAVLLGMDKTIVKSHGSSKQEAFKNAVLQAYESANHDISGAIARKIALVNGDEQ